jgi:gas vesicle protein GvpL/GvpF
MTARYVYGLTTSDTVVPPGLTGLGPSGHVQTIVHGQLAAIVSDLPEDRPLGTRDDLIAHESVVDTVTRTGTVLPMRFAAVLEERGVIDELLAPNHDHFLATLRRLSGHVQFVLKARYEQDVVLRELLEQDDELDALRRQVRALPEDAAYYQRLLLGERIVGALERRRDDEAAAVLARLEPVVARSGANHAGAPDEMVNVAVLVQREQEWRFVDNVEQLGAELHGRVRLRLHGPLAPYDFVQEE